MTAVVRVEDLTKHYGRKEALRGISFGVSAGEVFGLLGPNGAGKTTAVNIISSIVTPTSGRCEVMGYDCERRGREVRFLVGVAPANPRNLYWQLTGEENLLRFGSLYYLGRSEIRIRAARLLSRFQLDQAKHRKVGQYSSGMRARLTLAKALLHDPPVLLLDEPWATLDPEGRVELLELLRSLAAEQNKTVLLCSHDLHLVEKVCTRVAIIDDGLLLAEGSVDVLMSNLPYRFVIELALPTHEAAIQAQSKLLALNLTAARSSCSVRVETRDLASFLSVLGGPLLSEFEARMEMRKANLEDVYVQAMNAKRQRREEGA
jgi:ABC-2 type transport system ATP-binding protein